MNAFKPLDKLTRNILPVVLILSIAEVSAQSGKMPAQSEKNTAVTMALGAEAPDSCELLGPVKGSSKENDSDTNSAPYVERLIKARNKLRIETQKLGGDTVHITYSNNSGKYEVPGADKEIIFIGNAYRCD
ncbi:MAG: DUF4156 domain-containing protein [Proteobacteria bacterium]|nr:DUF4156 domain-containing protein [Pseudomonadota bacterium]